MPRGQAPNAEATAMSERAVAILCSECEPANPGTAIAKWG
jgi:hypothetical protein